MTHEIAVKLVEDLFDNLDDRSGFDTGGLDRDTVNEWKEQWVKLVMNALVSQEGRVFIHRARGDYWGAQAMEAIRNASPFASISHVLWGSREDRGEQELVIFIWVGAPVQEQKVEAFCSAQLDLIDEALKKIPNFKECGEFPNK